MVDDQAKAIADLKVGLAENKQISHWLACQAIDRAYEAGHAVSISRASQGSGKGMDEQRADVSKALQKTWDNIQTLPPIEFLPHEILSLAQAAIAALPTPESFQARVAPWMLACFGAEISGDMVERGDRLLEEVLEMLQSDGYDPARVAPLRDYVYGRTTGEPVQEAGGVMVTLAAYCLAADLDMHAAGETELARVWTKVDKIREKQAAKPKLSPLPIALSPPATPQDATLPARPIDSVERANEEWRRDGGKLSGATPQASEDVRSYDAEIFEVFVWALHRWQTKMTPEELAKSLVEAPAMKDLLAGGVRLLATPVTVTMEECTAVAGRLRVKHPQVSGSDVAEALRRVLGGRIQIAGEGPK